MVRFNIKLADINIGVSSFFETTKDFCKDYLTNSDFDFSVEMTKDDLISEMKKSIENDIREGREPVKYSAEYIETLALYRKISEIMPQYNVVLMHGAGIEVDGNGYLFTAKSGVGKTTHIGFWQKKFGDKCKVINGDKPLIKSVDDKVYIYGTPWQGKENYGYNGVAPLKSICFLQRAEKDGFLPFDDEEKFTVLFGQIYRPENQLSMSMTLDVMNKIMNNVQLCKFGCTLDPHSADISYNGMK